MSSAKTKKKTTSKNKPAKKRKSRSKKKTVLDKLRKNSKTLSVKDTLAVISGVIALSLSVVAILGWKFVSNTEFSDHKVQVKQIELQTEQIKTESVRLVDDRVFSLRYKDQELEKQIELLDKEDDHIKQKIQEVVVRQQNTDSKVERIDKNIVILLQQNRLQPAPAPNLKPLPNGEEAGD